MMVKEKFEITIPYKMTVQSQMIFAVSPSKREIRGFKCTGFLDMLEKPTAVSVVDFAFSEAMLV
ncbi:hypothetical protein [Paenibacillus sp. N3.4]|uniref:hypothetical protein n=1 Tax=Paenibacillus sp. N3.4 TaxID=2603222 RepID=UPI0011CA0FCD|nr:hypothetical protein [Paenibacillus sp. N3.4]TXK76593.1 hypothetical protein FU659_25045 [Paenibacillus sp. N3.4]